VTETAVLTLLAIGEGAFLVLLVAVLVVARARTWSRERHGPAGDTRLAEPLRRWLVGAGNVAEVAAALSAMRPDAARGQLLLVASKVAPSQLDDLATVLRGEPWLERLVRQARSRRWWRRLHATRLLGVVARPGDRALVRRLLADRHPAVQAAATRCLTRLADPALIAYVVDHLPERPAIVRLVQAQVLRGAWQQTVPVLLSRFRSGAPPARLVAWIELAEALSDQRCLAAAAALHRHPDATVRAAAARALRRYPHVDALAALAACLVDRDWRVRAEAARALGAVGGAAAVPPLVAALGDRVWQVRFRAALALAEIGEPGRRALAAVATLPDLYAREMAAMVSSLSDGHVAELAAV
jgi:HEAT repeat protein